MALGEGTFLEEMQKVNHLFGLKCLGIYKGRTFRNVPYWFLPTT